MERPGYYVYYSSTSSFSPKERKALYDLYGRDFFTKDADKDLSEEQVQRILSRVKPAMKKWLNASDLLPFLKRHHVLTNSELSLLNSSTLAQREQAIRLAEFLMNKGSYGIATFYLSLIESSEQLPAHYQLAGELKKIVHAEYGDVDEDPPSVDDGSAAATTTTDPSQSLQLSMQRLRGVKLPRVTVEALLCNLSLSLEDIHPTPSTLASVYDSVWRATQCSYRETNPFIEDFIQALVLTKTTGRYASLLCSTKEKSESPGVRNFFLTLGGQWELVADYLGYTREEVQLILQRFPDSVENQVAEFLEMWQLPSTGQLSLPLLHKLKALSGITSEPSASRKLADRKDVPSYVYMHKQLKTDAAGIPHRSLDSYQRTSPRAQAAFKAPYNSFTRSGSLSPPSSSPPKPPRSYSSSTSYNSPNSRAHQHARENYNSRSLDSSSSRYKNESSYYDDETVATISLRITTGGVETSHRPPPPPPRPANSSGSHDPSGQEMDLYSNGQTRSQPSSTGPRLVFMFFTGGGGSSADEMYGHAKRSYHQPDDDPVIKELPDDYPMEIIDNKSADDSSLPPLSDGRSSPAEELNNLDDDIGLIDPGDHSEQVATNITNDLNTVTPPSSRSQSPAHISHQENKPLQPATSPDFISSVAPSNISITPTLNDPPETSPYEATPSAAAPLAPVIPSLTEHASSDTGELLPPAVSPATLSAPAPATIPMLNLSANFSGEPASLILDDQGEAGLSTADSIVDDRIDPVTLSSIELTTGDNGEHLCPPVPPTALSAPASSTPVSNPSTTADDTPPPPTLNDQGEDALLTVGTSGEAQVASVSDTEHELYDDVALPPTVLPTTTVHADTSTTSPLTYPSATSDTTSAHPIITDQDVAVSNTVGPSVEIQPSTTNPSSIGYALDHDNKPLPPTVQPTIVIPGDSSPITPLRHPQATSDSSSTHPSLSDEGEMVPHAVGPSVEDQLAPVTSTPTEHAVDHNQKSSPLASPSATSLSEIPAITFSAPPSHPLASTDPPHSMLSDQSEKDANETAADNEPASKAASALSQPRVVAKDAHSSTYPPSSTVGEREAVVSSEISASIPGPSVIIHSEGAAMSAKLNGDAQEELSDLKDNKFTLHEEPRSFKMEDGEKEAVEYEPPVITSDLQAPDRRYHSRARLDSLEDRNNLDTDSEMQQSFSESEKESDTEDYPGRRPTRKRQRRHRRSSTSISSSEDERDPFFERRNDLSIVSSPDPELPHDGGVFGVSLSAGEGIVKEQSKFNDLSSQIPPPDVPQLQKLDVSTTDNLNERSTDKYEGKNFHERAAVHVDSTPTLQIESRKVRLLNEDREQGGFQTQLGSISPHMSARTLMLQGESNELHDTRQHKPPLSEQEMYTKEKVLKSEVVGEPYQSLSDPGLSSQHVYSGVMPNSEEEPMRTEPTHQVTRTSDPVLESTSSSSDQLQLPVRKSFSSHPPSIAPSLDRVDHLPKLPPVSLSAPSTGIHSMLDQPPPPFTHYAAPPPIFRAHVLEQQSDPVYNISMVEDMDVGDTAGQHNHGETMDVEEKYASVETGMEGHTEQRLMQNSLDSHRPFRGGSTSSTSHLIHAPSMFLSQDIVNALEDPNGTEVLVALLESGANVTLPTKSGEYAVHIAVRVENGQEKLKLLLQHGTTNRNIARAVDLKTPLHLACRKADLGMVQLILESEEADPSPQDAQGFTPLHYRQTLENADITECLIQKGAAVDIPSKDEFLTPLLVCCVVGSSTFDAAKLLVQSNASVNGVAQASTKPLVAASAVGYEAMVQLLLENNANINVMDQDQCTALLKACQNKHVSVAKRLCQRNFIDVNAPNKDNVTPLMAAVSNNAQDLAVVLIQNGAYHDASKVSRVGLPRGEEREFEITPMADAAVRGYLGIIEVIVGYGGQINAINERALPPIIGAVLANQVNVVEFFTKQNDLDCSLEGLMQPFIMAVRCGNQPCAELIMERYPGGIDMMLRSASDQGSEVLVQCIEIFQQMSLESPSEPPQVFLQPEHLPWNKGLEANGQEFTSKILTSIQNVDKEVQVQNEGGEQQGIEYQLDDQTSALESSYRQTFVTSGQPLCDSARFAHLSLASTSLPASGGYIDDTTTDVTLSQVGTGRPLEFSSQGQGATVQEALSHGEHDDELNQFDDDTSSDDDVQVLHVDDPRLGFGQSVYVGRRDTEQVTYSQPQPSLGRNVGSYEGRSSDMDKRSSGSVHTVTAPSSITGGLQVSPSDSLSRPPPLALPTASSIGSMLPLSTAAMGTVPPVNVPSVMPTSALGSQHSHHSPFQMPSVAQSVPASMPFGSSHAPISSLGVSASMPPLRARAVDEERFSEPGVGLSEEDRSLFAPRPKSPPPKATPPSPVRPSPISLQTPTSMASNVVEVLHEFAQITISAAVGQCNQEAIIDKAIASEFENVATFFLNYFYSPAEFARGSNLVSEFIGGTPSPLNFLLVNELVTKSNFKQLLSEMGRKGFVEQLTMVLHQFPGSDHLPWSEEEMLTALFTRTFSIGSLHPSMTSSKPLPLSVGDSTNTPSGIQGVGHADESTPIVHEAARPDSPPPPKPVSGPATEKQHTFPETGGHKLGHGSADDARVNNPRNIVTPSATASSKNRPTVPALYGGTTIAHTSSTQQQQQDRDDVPLKLTASRESLNSTVSSGLQVSVHSGSERPGQDSDTHLHTKKPKLTASHESLNSTTSSDQQISVYSGGESWRQQDTVYNPRGSQKPKFTASQDSLNSTSSSGQQSSIYGERQKLQEREGHPHTKSKLTVSHESLNSTATSEQQTSAHVSSKRLSEGQLEKPSDKSEHLRLKPERDVTKAPMENDIADVTLLASASVGMPNTVKFGNEIHVDHQLRHVQNHASLLPSDQMSSPIKLEEDKTSNSDELNDLDRTTPTEERVPPPPAAPGGISSVAPLISSSTIHEGGSVTSIPQPMIDEHSQQQQQLGDEPRLKGVEPLKQKTLDDDEMNNLDSDDDAHIPEGPAFDVIDNVSLSLARRREHSEQPFTTPSVVTPPSTEGQLHRVEISSESVPPLATESPLSSCHVSNHGFMPSLTVGSVASKSDLPRSLKSTYGTADVETLDSLQETSSTAPTFDLAKQMKSEFVQPLLGATNDSPKLTRKEQAGDELLLKDISLVKQHGKTDSMQLEDHHMANTDEVLPKLQNVKVPEYKRGSSEQTFTQPQGAMVVQDYQNQTEKQSRSSEDSLPLSQVPLQSKLSSMSTSHPTNLSLMSHRSSSSSSDMQLLSQPPLAIDAEYKLQSGNSIISATPRLNHQDTSENGFDISTLHSSRTLEESDTTDTETDEESRISLIPPSWSLTSAKERKPRVDPNERVSSTVHVDRENTPLKSSGFVEVSTGGAWNKKKKQTRTSGQTLSEESHITPRISLSQQPERPKIPKQLPAVDDASLKTKTDTVPKKTQLGPSPGKSAIPIAHHTTPKFKVTPSSSTTRLKTAALGGAKRLTAATKTTPDDKKKQSTPSSQSPILTRKVTGASKKVPTSSPSLRHKQPALPKSSPKEPTTKVPERRKQILHQHTHKSLISTPSTKKSIGGAQKLDVQGGKKDKVNPPGAKGHEKIVKAKHGITKARIEKPVQGSEDEKTVLVAPHQLESDNSLTSVGSGTSIVGSELQWTVSVSLIAKHTEQIFGIIIPNVVICGDKESELLETIAMRVSKWKMLGRYLGVDDDSLDEIETQNHFVGERCLKMLKKFQTVSGDEATYVRLSTALKNIKQGGLITDISQFFPKVEESTSTVSTSYPIKPTVKVDEMYTRLSLIREHFKQQKNNGKSKAIVHISYPLNLPTPPQANPLCFQLPSLHIDSIRVIEDVCIAAAVRKVKQLFIAIEYE